MGRDCEGEMSGERNWGKTKTRQKNGGKGVGARQNVINEIGGEEKRTRETKG